MKTYKPGDRAWLGGKRVRIIKQALKGRRPAYRIQEVCKVKDDHAGGGGGGGGGLDRRSWLVDACFLNDVKQRTSNKSHPVRND